MAISYRDGREVPMSVLAERALESVKKMSPAEAYQLFVEAGLMTEDEARRATIRAESKRKGRRKSGASPKGGTSGKAEESGTS